MNRTLGTVLRTLGQAAAGSPPSAPVISAAPGSDGLSAVVTVTSAAGVTNRLYYALAGANGLIAGGTRVGSGTITQTGLVSGNLYQFVAQSAAAGVLSPPSNVATALIQGAAPLPIVEQLVQAVQTAYLALVSAGTLTALARPAQIDENMPLEHLKCVLVQFPVEPIERGTIYWRKRLTVALICPIRPEKGDATAIQQYQNFYGSRLENIALNNLDWGLPQFRDGMTDIRGPFPFQDGRKVDGVYLELVIPFRHLVTDTFQ